MEGRGEHCSLDLGPGMDLLPAVVKLVCDCEGEVERGDEFEEAEDQKQFE